MKLIIILLLISSTGWGQCPAGKVWLPSTTNTHCIVDADTCVTKAVYDRVMKWCSGEVQHNIRRIDLKNLKRDYPISQWNNAKNGEYISNGAVYYKLNYEFVGYHNGEDNGLWLWDELKFKKAVRAALDSASRMVIDGTDAYAVDKRAMVSAAAVALSQIKNWEAFKISFKVYVGKRLKL